MLPLKHSTAEELAALVWRRVIDELGVEKLVKRGITALEVSVAEAPSQEARYTRPLAGYDPREEVRCLCRRRGRAVLNSRSLVSRPRRRGVVELTAFFD